jgi:hypothetical protein
MSDFSVFALSAPLDPSGSIAAVPVLASDSGLTKMNMKITPRVKSNQHAIDILTQSG